MNFNNIKREVIETLDGSKTIRIKDVNEHYHSVHGALQEAYHVYISSGLQYYSNIYQDTSFAILEIGFGTGLNCLLTLLEAKKNNLFINYYGVDAYPVSLELVNQLGYDSLLKGSKMEGTFDTFHNCKWDQQKIITPFFKLTKVKKKFSSLEYTKAFNVIYFDAFGSRVQPELWTENVFEIMYKALKEKGVLVTYSAKGSVRRILQKMGFKVEKLPGPPGKREMLRATKSC